MALPLPRLLRAWARAFAARRDVFIVDSRFEPGIEAGPALGDLPPDAAAFARACGGVELTWVFDEDKEKRDGFSKGYRGGRLNLRLDGAWYPRAGWEWVDLDEHAMLDDMVEEAGTWLVTRNGAPRSKAALLFHPSSGPEGVRVFRSLEEYLTEGARRAFVWYWQKPGYWEADEFVGRLREGSIAEDTPAEEIARALEARGIEAEEATALVEWLGAQAALLVDAR